MDLDEGKDSQSLCEHSFDTDDSGEVECAWEHPHVRGRRRVDDLGGILRKFGDCCAGTEWRGEGFSYFEPPDSILKP